MEAAESAGLVETQCHVVSDGCVHEHPLGPPPGQPAQAIVHQGPTHTLALLVGMDRQTLEEAQAGIAPSERIARRQ